MKLLTNYGSRLQITDIANFILEWLNHEREGVLEIG